MPWRYLLLTLATGGLLVPGCSADASQVDLTAADCTFSCDVGDHRAAGVELQTAVG